MSEEYSNGYARGYEAGQQSVLKLAEQPAQQEPQSMALNAAMGYIMRHTPKLVHDEICKALRRPVIGASPQPAQQEPVAHVMFRQDEDGLEPIMFYGPGTAPDPATLKDRFVLKDVWLSPPAQRTWVGLTDEEIYMNCPNWLSQEQCKVWIQQIEAKLKEKNNG